MNTPAATAIPAARAFDISAAIAVVLSAPMRIPAELVTLPAAVVALCLEAVLKPLPPIPPVEEWRIEVPLLEQTFRLDRVGHTNNLTNESTN